jgi:hypothetical protein
MTWMILSIFLFIICVYLTIRVFRLRKALRAILMQLDNLKRKIPVLKP